MYLSSLYENSYVIVETGLKTLLLQICRFNQVYPTFKNNQKIPYMIKNLINILNGYFKDVKNTGRSYVN
jgi:hypothetical protein